MRAMTDPGAANSQAPVPRTTHEFRLDEAVRAKGHAYVRYRDGDAFHAVALTPASSAQYIGRDDGCAIAIRHDGRVSRRHARLIFGAGQWSIEDGPSRNGTLVNSRPTVSEHILTDGAQITVGRTILSFHDPPTATIVTTLADEPTVPRLRPTPTQRKVLIELARPFMADGDSIPVPPTNAAIAGTLGYQPSTIRDAISDLYRQAGLVRGESEQRSKLVQIAISDGTVARADYS